MYAAIDIGTNAARLLIAKINTNNGNLKKISYTRVPLRLGFDVFENNRITQKKLKVFKNTMIAFSHLMEAYDVKDYRAYATSAMREADNSEFVQAYLKGASGINIEVISGKHEASLLYSSVSRILDINSKNYTLLIDIGGGSTELTVFKGGQVQDSRSFELGTIRILKKKNNAQEWSKLKKWLQSNVSQERDIQILGAGGNFNKIAKLLGYNSQEIIPIEEFRNLKSSLEKLSLNERMNTYDLKADRADVIIPACEISDTIFKQTGVNRFAVPKVGISDGIIRQLYENED